MTTNNKNLINSISLILKISVGVVILGLVLSFVFYTLLFGIGWLMGAAVGIGDLFLLACFISRLGTNSDGLKLRFVLLFIGKTIVLLLVLGIVIYFLSKISIIMLWGFIAGLSTLPVSILLFIIYSAVKQK